jgi:hypothetical protein
VSESSPLRYGVASSPVYVFLRLPRRREHQAPEGPLETTCSSLVFRSVGERSVIHRLRLVGCRQQAVALENSISDIDDLAIRPSSVVAKELERTPFIHRVALHQDPLRTLGDGAASERTFERVVLSEPLE